MFASPAGSNHTVSQIQENYNNNQLDADSNKPKDHIAINIGECPEGDGCKGFLENHYEPLKKHVDGINNQGWSSTFNKYFYKSEVEKVEGQKAPLNQILDELKRAIDSENLSIEERLSILNRIYIEANKKGFGITIPDVGDQGKLEDMLFALTISVTNLWKGLVDSKSLTASKFIQMSIPFMISVAPLAIRIVEYIRIQLNATKNKDTQSVLSAYKQISKIAVIAQNIVAQDHAENSASYVTQRDMSTASSSSRFVSNPLLFRSMPISAEVMA